MPPPEWQRLDRAVRALVEQHAQLQRRVRTAETRAKALEEALRKFTAGDIDPTRIAARVRALEEENRTLRARLEQGRAVIARAVARLEFFEQSR